MKRDTTHLITNQEEASNFLRGAIVWRGSVTPRIMPMLLLSLDRIGIELQKPFDKKSLSHLPLDALCEAIKLQGLNLWEHDKCPKTNA